MAQLPSGQFLIQQIGADVVLFDRDTEDEVVRFPPASADLAAKAQERIASSGLSEEDKAFAHFWSGYFYAHSGTSMEANR